MSADISSMDTKRAPTVRPGPTHALLAVVAAMLGFLVFDRAEERALRASGSVALASAGDPPEAGGSLISAADQRKQIIAELRTISQRLDGMDKRLAKPLPVRVVEMPAQPAQKDKPAPGGEK